MAKTVGERARTYQAKLRQRGVRRTTVWFEPDEDARLNALADQEGGSKTAVLRKALDAYWTAQGEKL